MVGGEAGAEDTVVGEPRWPMASAVVAAIVLIILMPDDLRLGPSWLLPVIEGGLLVALIVGDPGRIDRRTANLRRLSLGLVCALIAGALWATAILTSHLITGGNETHNASALLEAGAIVWASNIIAFALLYWELRRRRRAAACPPTSGARSGLRVPAADEPEPRAPTLAPRLR